jgi:hypothetical protein
MSEKIWKIIKANLLDTRLVSVGFSLLAVVFLDFLFLHVIIPELDTLEHLLFGFVLSEFANNTAKLAGSGSVADQKAWTEGFSASKLVDKIVGFSLDRRLVVGGK